MIKRKRHDWIVFWVCALITVVSLAAFMLLRPAAKVIPASASAASFPAAPSLPPAGSGLPPGEKPDSETPDAPLPAVPAARPAEGNRTAYLTFDDGPSPLTQELLSQLKENGVCATFFIVGSNAQKYPDSLKQMAEDGDVIGVHS